MKRFRRVATVCALVSVVPFGAFLLQCSSEEPQGRDPSDVCDEGQLSTTDPAEATVKLYLQTAAEATDRATKLTARFKDICNAINRDLGETEGGDVHAACNKIADHIAAANAVAPIPDGGLPPPVWASVLFSSTCPLDGKAAGDCLDMCSGKSGCDSVATCPKGQATGTCKGMCAACVSAGDNVACTGACSGQCDFSAVPDGGPACQGECRGTCKAPTWLGACAAGCNAGFRGRCGGTCTGACDAVPYPPIPLPVSDAGDPADSGADADAAPEAGPATAPGSGNCGGVCTGKCSDMASGSCAAPCMGDFTGGSCPGPGNCVGVCNGIGVACVTSCNGACTTRGACATNCAGGCDGPLDGAKCGATPECNEPNPICKSVCTLRGALATTCTPAAMDIRIAGDYKLPFALRAHAADFTAAAREATLIASTLGGVLQRPTGDFRQIGVVRDNARACAKSAQPSYDGVRKLVNEAVGASLVIKGVKF